MEDCFKAAEIFVKKQLGGVGDGHDFDHTLRVVRYAMKLCDELPAADRVLVHMAALLHDVGRPSEAAASGGIDHAEAGARLAETFLREQHCDGEWVRRIVQCVREHRYRSERRPTSLESEILFDADKLDSLGATGLARAFLFAGRVGARVHNTAAEALAGAPYSREDTAYREYLVKLSKLPEALLTGPGRREAAALRTVMEDFFVRLNGEIYGGGVEKR